MIAFSSLRMNNKSNWHFDFSKVPIDNNLMRCVRVFFVCFIGACSNYRIEKQFLYMFKLNFILCLRWKTLILWAARRFWNSDMWTMARNTHTAMEVLYAMHTPTHWHQGIALATLAMVDLRFILLYFILFDFQMELKCQLRLNRCEQSRCATWAWAHSEQLRHTLYVCTIRMWNAFYVLVKCVFVWSFLFNFETVKA